MNGRWLALALAVFAGVTLADCVRINQRLSAWLDDLSAIYANEESDFIKGSYYLEVNSPGLDRPLKTEKDFLRAAGQPVKVIWRDAEGKVKTLAGDVAGVTAEAVTIREAHTSHPVDIALGSVIKAEREIK